MRLLLLVAAAALWFGLAPSRRRRSASPAPAEEAPLAGATVVNPAEAMQSSHAMGAYAGIGQSLPDDAASQPLVGHTAVSQDDPAEETIAPGLPDFARGA